MRTIRQSLTSWLALGVLSLALAQEPPRGAGEGPVEYLPRATAAEKQILDALEQVSNASFDDSAFAEVVGFLRESHKVNIVVDQAALRQANLAELPNVSLELTQIRLKSVLNIVCKSNDLAWIIDDEVIKITTPAAASSQFLTRTYPVSDLCESPDDLKSLKSAVERTATTAAWDVQGGQGSVASVESVRSLVVTQTWSGHQQVLNVLRMLREARKLSATPAPLSQP